MGRSTSRTRKEKRREVEAQLGALELGEQPADEVAEGSESPVEAQDATTGEAQAGMDEEEPAATAEGAQAEEEQEASLTGGEPVELAASDAQDAHMEDNDTGAASGEAVEEVTAGSGDEPDSKGNQS